MVLSNGRVKLTDFGIAQSTDDPRLTTSGILVGSPSYIAPERLRGAEADAGSDLWALAAVLFYAVEGHSPFERSSTAATMHAILSEVPYLTRSQGPLASAIMGLLNNTPQARLSATQVRGLLAQATNTPPTGTQATMFNGTGYPGGTAMLPTPGVTQHATGPGRATPPRRRARLFVAALVAVLAAGLAGGWFGGRALLAAQQPVDDAKGATMTYGKGGDIPEFAVSNGSCPTAQLRSGGRYPSDGNSACEDPHEFEVYDSDDLDTSELDYQSGYVRSYAESLCAMLFRTNLLSSDADRDKLSYATLYPTEQTWDDDANDDSDDGGDRSIYCLVTNRDQTQQLQGPQLSQG
jgi:hypothetical protein